MKFLSEKRSDLLPAKEAVLDSITDPSKLHHHLLAHYGDEEREYKYRSLYLSSVDSACPREWVLGNCLGMINKQVVPVANRWQMDMGSVLHWHIQNNPKYFGDKIVGWWKCLACGFIRRFGVRPKEPCEKCHAHPRVSEYYEYKFRITTPYRAVGKMDLILRIAPRIYRIGEIKTCSKNIERPEGDHIAQAASYAYFSRYDTSGRLPITLDRSTVYLFYFNKTFNFRGPVRTFPVQPTERLMAPIKEKVALITEGVNTRTLPQPLTNCISHNFITGRAKDCGISKECKKYFESGVTQL